MSAAAKDATWLKQNYEKLILIVVLVALLVSGLILVGKTGGERVHESDAGLVRASSSQSNAEKHDLSEQQEQFDAFLNPPQAKNRSNQMLVSEERIRCYNTECAKPIPFAAEVCPFCETRQPKPIDPETLDSDGDGMPNAWEMRYGLDPRDPSDAHTDIDGDGFTNIEEFLAGTDPTDSESFPEPIAKLRWVRIFQHPFNLRFQGVSSSTGPDGEILIFQINLRSLERTYFVQMGETIEDSGYSLVRYEPEAAAGATIYLKKGDQEIPLVKGRVLQQHEFSVGLISLIDKKTMRKRLNETIEMLGRQYKVIDIRRDGVVVASVETGEKTRLGQLTSAERMELTGERPRVSPGEPFDGGMPAGGPSAADLFR